jgi:hypothetical protein
MSRLAVLLLVLLLIGGRAALTQTQTAHAPDGGTRETITSIAVPPLPNVPFSATVNTEWISYLRDGASRALRNHRLIARDRQGRVFQERRYFAPDGDRQETRLTQTEIADPETHTLAICDGSRRVCDLRIYRAEPTASLPPAGPSPNGTSFLTRDALGLRIVNGFEANGTREVQTVDATANGTDRPISVVKEFWYSPQLGLNLFTRRTDPRRGIESFTVSDINLAEPDPALFALPKGAQLVDRRATTR